MHDWPDTTSLRQEIALQKNKKVFTCNVEAIGPTFEAAFITGQVHFRMMLDQQGVDWRSVDSRLPETPDQSEVRHSE